MMLQDWSRLVAINEASNFSRSAYTAKGREDKGGKSLAPHHAHVAHKLDVFHDHEIENM